MLLLETLGAKILARKQVHTTKTFRGFILYRQAGPLTAGSGPGDTTF